MHPKLSLCSEFVKRDLAISFSAYLHWPPPLFFSLSLWPALSFPFSFSFPWNHSQPRLLGQSFSPLPSEETRSGWGLVTTDELTLSAAGLASSRCCRSPRSPAPLFSPLPVTLSLSSLQQASCSHTSWVDREEPPEWSMSAKAPANFRASQRLLF